MGAEGSNHAGRDRCPCADGACARCARSERGRCVGAGAARSPTAASPVELLYRGYRSAAAGSVGVSLLTVAALWQEVETSLLIAWTVTMWTALALRGWAAWRFLRAVPDASHDARHANGFAIGAAVSGALWGATAFLFVSAAGQPALSFITLVLGGVTAAACALYAAMPRAAVAFVVAALLPYGLRLVLFGDRFSLAMAASTALYLAILLGATAGAHRFIVGARAAHRRRAHREELRLRVFERLLGESPLVELLRLVIEYVEAADPQLHCCVRLVATDAQRVHTDAASSPATVCSAAIEAKGIGDCGAMGALGTTFLVADMLDQAGREPLRTVAQAAGLRSCWSVPIRDAGNMMLGTFTVYRAIPGLPERADLALLREASHLAGVAIAHRHAAERQRAREQEFRSLVEHAPDSLVRYDTNCRLVYANPQALRQAGMRATTLQGRTPSEFPGGDSARQYQAAIGRVLAGGGTEEFDLHWTSAAGIARHTRLRLEPEHDEHGRIVTVLAVGRDLTRIVEYRQRLHELAYVDTLTGLPNRARLKEHLHRTAMDAARYGRPATLVTLGLDRFKSVNDTFGRHCGDALLRATSERLHRSLGHSCIVARLEGDEFAILLSATGGERGADASPAILDTLAAPFQVGSMEIRLTASLGIAHAPEHGVEAEELLRCAAMALHHAKLDGRNRARRYAPELTAAAQQRLALETDLRKAVAAGAFELHYQPKVDLGSGAVVGAEALLRWRHPERGMLAPARFIGLAEETGLISELGEWALRSACHAARRWNEKFTRHCPVAVNLSARQFADGRLADSVRRVLEETGCRPEWIELEITESLLLDDHPEIHATLDTLDQLGVSLAIDDFGTGYSALAYLARFPIRTLKIDRSFISEVVTNPDSATLVRAIVSMARSLRMSVVAEGVEALEQADFLHGVGCRLVQGFLYGRPMREEIFEALLEAPAPALCLLEPFPDPKHDVVARWQREAPSTTPAPRLAPFHGGGSGGTPPLPPGLPI